MARPGDITAGQVDLLELHKILQRNASEADLAATGAALAGGSDEQNG